MDHCQLKVPASEHDKCSTDHKGIESNLGIINPNMQYLVSTPDEIVTCATVARMVDAEASGRSPELILVELEELS